MRMKEGGDSKAMAPHLYGIVAAEIMSVFFCLVILYGSIFETREKSIRNTRFSILVGTCVIALILDSSSWILEGHAEYSDVIAVCSTASMTLSFVLAGLYISFLSAYIREQRPISRVYEIIYYSYCFAGILFTVIFSAAGKLFQVQNGVYSDGPWYSVYMIINIVGLPLSIIPFLLYGKSFSRHDLVGTVLYVVIPTIVSMINLFNPNFSYAYPAAAVSLLILYVMIQSEHLDRLKRQERVSAHLASHDELTGLLNRRAFDESIRALSVTETTAGVLFSDINGLKYTNDRFGHEAGDRLLTGFADLLATFFRKEEIFRISGDEFVVIMSDVTEATLQQRASRLEHSLETSSVVSASIGSAWGKGKDILKLIKAAENSMYERKILFHEAHPEMHRQYTKP